MILKIIMKKILLSIVSLLTIQTAFAQTKQYTDGFFIVNEDWFGHSNGSVNFVNKDNTVDYNIYKTTNPTEELGVTTQYGTIYGDNFYLISKQGNRLVVADAKTLEQKATFGTIGADGRTFVGVDAKKGYIGTSKGIYLFDIEKLQIGALIEGTDKVGQIAAMVRTSKYVFATSQNGGILVIDPIKNTIKQAVAGKFISLVQTKDGNIWGALETKLVKIDPTNLQTTEVSIPTAKIANTWGFWNAGSYCAATQSNDIYFASGINIIKFDATTEKFDEAFAKVPGQDTTPKQTIYGAGLRIDPASDNLILTTVGAGWGANSEQNWAHTITNKGELINTVKLSAYYWFPALPVFQDNAAPKITDLEATYHINSTTTIDLKDKVSDTDNLASAIVKELEIIENDDIAEVSINENDELVINPLKNGTAKIKVSFNSNGKVVEQLMTISTAVLGTNDLTKSAVNIYPNPVNNVLFIEVKEADKAEIYNITGTKITEKTLQKGKNQLEVSNLPKGVYIIKVNNSTFKIIKK